MQTTNSNQIAIGSRIVRLDGKYTAGNKGRVFEIDEKNGRARIEWDGMCGGKPMPRTWIRFAALKLETI